MAFPQGRPSGNATPLDSTLCPRLPQTTARFNAEPSEKPLRQVFQSGANPAWPRTAEKVPAQEEFATEWPRLPLIQSDRKTN